MLFFQDEKDKLKQELAEMTRDIQSLRSLVNHQVRVLTERLDSLTHPHGAKKDGSPRAKPGRKPGVKA
jgi:SMC interacting uncharacterized protein involved in chromosome segregation